MKMSQTGINEIHSEVFYLQQQGAKLKTTPWKKTPAQVEESSYYITQCILIRLMFWGCEWLQMKI